MTNLVDVRNLEGKRVADPALRDDDADEEELEGTNQVERLPFTIGQ